MTPSAEFLWNHGGLEITPATLDRWPAFEALFGERGACAGCWCMWFRVSRRIFEAGKGDVNREAMRALFAGDEPPGLLAFRGAEPVGWVAVGPRTAFPRLESSRVARRVDDVETWSIVCLFVAQSARASGVATALLEAAAAWVAFRGGEFVEGYGVDPGQKRLPDVFAFHGPAAAYRAAGYDEIARPTETRPTFRREAGRSR
ncbi:MAG: GNAT family N-acetyltransferase [Planctomycetota bacterium]